MAKIKKITIKINTGNIPDSGTDGNVYIGICGREFYLDIKGDNDFERGVEQTYILGEGANIKHAKYNNPSTPQLETEDLNNFPKYIRFEPMGLKSDWNFKEVIVTVYSDDNSSLAYKSLANLWLGEKMGKFCYLK